MSQENKRYTHILIGKNRYGKYDRALSEIKAALLKGRKVGIIGIHYPNHIISDLLQQGITVKSKPMMNTCNNFNIIFDFENFIGIDPVQKTQTGFIFYCE